MLHVGNSCCVESSQKRGPYWRGHIAWHLCLPPRFGSRISHCAAPLQGLLQFMGPFLTLEADDCGDGMFCLRAHSLAEAKAIAARNPFHRRGIRTYTVRPWLEKILS